MVSATCEFCGRDCSEHINVLFIRSIDDILPDEEKQETNYPKKLHICDSCLHNVILNNIGNHTKKDEDPEPGKAFVGMELREFLCTSMYLSTQNIVFRTQDDTIIRDFHPWMRRKVLYVGEPDTKTQEINVIIQ